MTKTKKGIKFILAGVLLMALTIFAGCAKQSVPPPDGTITSATTSTTSTSDGESITSCDKVYETTLREYMASEPVKTEEITQGQVVYEGEGQIIGEIGTEGRTSAPMLPIYFDFDRYNIRPDMISRMEENASFLKEFSDIKIEIQGNCDERGTNEYNLALGEKRALSAKRYLVNLGISPSRIDVVSFGEEKPLDPGHNEAAWAKNRRDDFVIKN